MPAIVAEVVSPLGVSVKPGGNVPALTLHVYGSNPPDAAHATETADPTTSGSVVGAQLILNNCPHAAPAVSAANTSDLTISRVISVDQIRGCPA